MRTMSTIAARLIAVTIALNAAVVQADEIRVLSSVGIKAVVEVLGPQFEQATKHKVTTVFDLAGVLKTRIEGGEPFDVAILTPAFIDELISKGKIVVGVPRGGRAHRSRPDDSRRERRSRT